MIILDTDHVVVLKYPGSQQSATLASNMAASLDQELATTAITIEEQLRGWLAVINRSNDVHQQIPAYERLVKLFDFFAPWKILPLDAVAADQFKRLRQQRIRIGTMDLKIAAIALANNATLLSANLQDFRRVPDLRVENWLI